MYISSISLFVNSYALNENRMNKAPLLIIALCFAASQAQPPHFMQICKHDGTTDTASFVRIDSTTIGNLTDFVIHLNRGGAISVPIDQIDSILFPYVGGPAYKILQPIAGRVFHVGDSVTVQWVINPRVAFGVTGFVMSTDAGKTWHGLTNVLCFMIRIDSSRAGAPCFGGMNYPAWPYVTVNGKLIGTWKFKISNPMSMPDTTVDHFNPISDSVIIRVGDMHGGMITVDSEIFSIKP